MIVSPSLLSRTIAGIPEKESAGFFFLFLTFYFFLSAWKSKTLSKNIIFAFLAGVSTVLMSLIWGGSLYIYLTIAFFALIYFILGKTDKLKFIAYSIWLAVSILSPVFLTERFNVIGTLTSTSGGLCVAAFLLMAIELIIFKTRIKETSLVRKLREKAPDKIITIGVFILLVIILSVLVLGISFIPGFINDILSRLTQPYGDRLSFTVAENRQPYFSEWGESFGPIIKNIPLIFLLFFIGSIMLFYEIFEKLNKKERFILVISYIIFIFSLIFSRYSAGSIMNGVNSASSLVYFGGFLILIISFVYIFYKYYKEGKLEEFNKVNFSYLFLLAFFIPAIIGARSAIRLVMALVPSAVAIAGYFSVAAIERARKPREEIFKIISISIAVLIAFSSLYAIYINYNVTIGGAKQMIPSVYTQQWQKAMAWVRNSTPENAVFGHWWDYGYWVQTMGERATMLDGGNAISYWDYLMGRHGLTAGNETEALELLYSHNVSYFLIDSTDIGKYSAYSNIGSDENYDRYSWISTFLLDESRTQETKNETILVYPGGTALDEDLMWNVSGQKILFPAGRAGIGAVLLRMQGENITGADAIFVYQNNQVDIPLKYAYYKEKVYDFNSGYGGCAYIFPSITGTQVKSNGAVMLLSERNMRALWVRLYLLGEGKNFELVHNEPSYVTQALRNQGIDVGDVVFYQGVQGPIKIWKVNYNGDEKVNPEYIQGDYPERIKDRRNAV